MYNPNITDESGAPERCCAPVLAVLALIDGDQHAHVVSVGDAKARDFDQLQ
jgi:hypothetical protein